MPRVFNQKRMCNPAGIPDAEYFGKRKRRRKVERSEPLPGTKQTLSSEDDGQLEQLLTAHDSETIPNPSGGRKLVLGQNDGQLEGVLSSQSRQTVTNPKAKVMGQVAFGLSILLLLMVVSSSFIVWPEPFILMGMVGFAVMHICVLCSQLMSDGKNGLGVLSLLVFYPGYILWCLLGGML